MYNDSIFVHYLSSIKFEDRFNKQNSKAYSNDPKCRIVSIDYFYQFTDYLCDIEKQLWKDVDNPSPRSCYFKITSEYLMCILYGAKYINFGMDIEEQFFGILLAERDGNTEYKLLKDNLTKLKNKHYKSEEKINYVENLEQIVNNIDKYFPPYNKEQTIIKNDKFEDYLIKVKKFPLEEETTEKYVVLDVETNGLRYAKDDLLSISIYDPINGICYNRYLPLDNQPIVLTKHINGINEQMLKGCTHITQSELDKLIKFFNLKECTILTYSGGKGTFDYNFIVHYLNRHNLHGFEDLKYQNIKQYIPAGSYEISGKVTKDNLCKLFNIKGVGEKHTSFNDCLLEWELFKKIGFNKYFFMENKLYKFNPNYIFPITHLLQNTYLQSYIDITLPNITGLSEKVFEYHLPPNVVKLIKKFPTNITGVTVEHAINTLLQVNTQNNKEFLIKNKSNIELIASLESNYEEIKIVKKDNGLIESVDSKYDDEVYKINQATKSIMENINPVINFIKNNIFKNEQILSQELIISNDKKILALCDLSSKQSILEIKTFNIFNYDGKLYDNITQQLFFQARDRNKFILSMEYISNKNNHEIINDVIVSIYKINFGEKSNEPYIYKLSPNDKNIIKLIKQDCNIKQSYIAFGLGLSLQSVMKIMGRLKLLGYIEREGSGKKSTWKVLKEE